MPNHEPVHEHPFLNQLNHEDLVAILPYVDEHEHADGSLLLARGEVSDSLHIILSGTVETHIEHENDISLAKLGRGRFFGEWSCLAGEPVHAEYRADENLRTLSVSRPGMVILMDRCPPFRDRIIEIMMRHIRTRNEQIWSKAGKIPTTLRQLDETRELRLGSLAGGSRIMQGLRQQIDVLASKDEPVCIIGEKGVGKFHIACEIHYRSDRSLHPILSVAADSYDAQAWEMTVRAAAGGTIIIEQSDLMPADLLHRLIRSANKSRIIMTGQTMPDVIARHIMVAPLRLRSEDIPALVYAWLIKSGIPSPEESISEEALRMLSMYPYPDDNIDGLHRILKKALARSGGKSISSLHLRFDRVREPGTRPTIGLALGSGSVRGAAHVGIMKVLEEEQIPIDLIAGSSVGAFIGALYAGGQPISAFERVLPTVRWRQLLDLTLPPKAFVDNRRMIRFLESYIGPAHFEDLPIPFAVTAADAATGEGCILNTGPVSAAVCASTAIPGVMKPVRYNHRLLIDGGVVHPVPVQLAKCMGADIVIAADLGTSSYAKRDPKNFVVSILNTLEIMSDNILREELQLADVVLNPQLNIQVNTFKSSTAYIREGVRATREMVTAIKRLIHRSMAERE
ncbi:cyclic nucleotide-binding domain-containing protein [Paenibacillus mesophilus]|uniref:patatin-like phospholipase family protein n=1 Tax=Paenibacillus mesophilus TaxID=2582849 RepID=UPI00110E7959|nr:patatin-like phospholipase family protein [Paenibacillus mesophilus]TMV48676.1 cyclic nucleotide-binding domain-containing protein [Paenibacillus mesophilus]